MLPCCHDPATHICIRSTTYPACLGVAMFTRRDPLLPQLPEAQHECSVDMSSGCSNLVRPPGMMAGVELMARTHSLLFSVMWANVNVYHSKNIH